MKAVIAVSILVLASLPALALEPTPSQTEGPYYPSRKPADRDADLTRVGDGPVARGDVLVLKGRVVDTTGKAVEGAQVEIWQVDGQGIYLHPNDPGLARRDKTFQGYGETRADAQGRFTFRTLAPPAYEGRPRHIHVKVTPPAGRTLTTQLYFKDDPLLLRDGIARRLGPALDRVVLAPEKVRTGGVDELAASIDLVIGPTGR